VSGIFRKFRQAPWPPERRSPSPTKSLSCSASFSALTGVKIDVDDDGTVHINRAAPLFRA
jgi:hypothetical protein